MEARLLFPFFAAALLCTSPLRSQEVSGAEEARKLIEQTKDVGKSKNPICSTAEKKYPLPADECRTLRGVEGILEGLLSIAGFSRGAAHGQVRFFLDLKRGDDIFYYEPDPQQTQAPEARYIVMGLGWLTRRASNNTAVAATLSHEIGHAVQHRDLSPDEWKSYTPRQLESHADLIGTQIAKRAGYSADQILQARASYGCVGDDDAKHATNPDRWVNSLLAAEALPQLGDDARQPFRMLVSPAVFDEEGRLLTKPRHEASAQAEDDRFITIAGNSWTRATALTKDRALNNSQLRDLAVQACGSPEARDLPSAISDALANPRRIINIPISR